MKDFFKSTAGIIITLIIIVIAVWLIITSQWFKNMMKSKVQDNTPCITIDSISSTMVAGTTKNGICIPAGGPPPAQPAGK